MQTKMGEGTAAEVVPAKEFVLSTYSPHVAVICSPSAESVVAKNNLKFAQLLLPFTRLTTEVSWLEASNGQQITPRGLRITPVDLATWKPSDIDSQKNRKILNNAVAQNPPPLLQEDITKFRLHTLGGAKGNPAEYNVQVPISTPWFDSWRETFLRLQSESQIAQYEFLHHFMASILVISSSEGKTAEDLANTIGRLSKLQLQHQSEWPNSWAFPSVLKFYLILHNTSSEEQASADAMYHSLRTMYGGNFCYMLQIQDGSDINVVFNCEDLWSRLVQPNFNTKDSDINDVANSPVQEIIVTSEALHPLSPDLEKLLLFGSQNGEILRADPGEVRGKYLSIEDLKNIQMTINEFISKALLPYIERQSRLLHESILNRRGMSKSVLSAAKRLFGTTAKTASSVVYATESLEMMSRKLADVYFLFGHYAGAYQLYHQLKKDFLSDSAWTYFSSSLEMAAVSHFMMSQVDPPLAMARAFPVHYIGDAINHYIDYCRLIDSATKCALICSECLKQMDNFGEAAAIYIRMTSEECDLRSALMLEQAAYAFLRLNSPRKYALHCVLAGHRYSKAGLKMHSLNCYLQASQIYSGKGWRFAEDHVHFTVARHQSSLQITNEISKYLQSLLITPTPQPPQQIQTFYKEYLSTMAKNDPAGSSSYEFFVPSILSSEIRIRIAVSNLVLGELTKSAIQEEQQSVIWDALEEHVVKECVKNSVISFKPSRMIYHSGIDNTVNPTVPSNETFYVEVPLLNTLSVPIYMRNIRLQFDTVDNVDSSVVSELNLQPGETKMIRFSVCSSSTGRVSFNWIFYELELSPLRVSFKQKVTIIGPRLNSNISERSAREYAKDLRNQINIIGKMPLLQANVDNLPATLYHAQSIEFQIVLSDKSKDCDQRNRIHGVVVAMDNMKDCLEVHSNWSPDTGLSIESVQKNYCKLKASFNDSSEICRIPCIFKAPQSGDFATLNVLLLYQFNSTEPRQKTHRVINISIRLPLNNCLKLEYSTLKLLNARSSVGLLRAHNLTPDGNISINQMKFSDKSMIIEELNNSATERDSNENSNCVQLTPMESRNVILKVEDTGNIVCTKESIFLDMDWELERSGKDSMPVKGCSRVLIEDLKNFYDLEENSLIFELDHKSRTIHDFINNPCLVFPISVLVHSRSSGKIILQIDKNATSTTIGPGVKVSGDEIFFVGQTSWIFETIAMNTNRLEYSVAVTRPGIYNIAPIFNILSQDGATVQRKYTLHSPLIVAQSSSIPTLPTLE